MYIGIDLGTSSIKTVLMDDAQAILATSTFDFSVQRPHEQWSEQEPSQWIEGIEHTLGDLASRHKDWMGSVKGIGLSGHMHGATLLDQNDTVLRPCMLWNDTRSHAQAHAMDTPRTRDIAGNIVFPGFTAPKVQWVRENEPTVFERISKVLLPKDYARLWLSGEYVSDQSDASGT
ncbi:MAG: xylulokinase, partial [Gammaproteobacteria bacterium]|nr:xylulokinase [Gammaproteobacteria bacterium]